MNDLLIFVLYSDLGSNFNNWVMFGFRILLLVELIRVHGFKKLEGDHDTPNPLGLPQKLNNFISALAMAYLPFFLLAGLFTRLLVIPALMVTAIGYFVIHRRDDLATRDIPYMYSISLLLLLLLGPGTISMDHWMFNQLIK